MTLLRPRRELRVSSGPAPMLLRHPRRGLHLADADSERLRRNSTVFACRDLISRMTSTIPVYEYARVDGRLERVSPASWLNQDSAAGVDGVGGSLINALYATLDTVLSRGMGFLYVTSIGSDGWPATFETVDPSEISAERPYRGTAGAVRWSRNGVRTEVWPAGPLVILHGYPVAGQAYSISPIANAALTIDSSLLAQEFAYQFFRDSAVPTGVLTNASPVSPTARGLALENWDNELVDNRRTRVLSHGWEYKPLSIAPNESQFLETIQASDPQIARFFGVDPREIGASVSGNSTLTYQNPELDLIRLLTRTLSPWVIRLEQMFTSMRPRGRVVRFDTAAFLRMDTKTRYDAYGLAIRNGYMSVNEVRERENLPEIENGDQYLWPPMRTQLDNAELQNGADPTDPGFGEPAAAPAAP